MVGDRRTVDEATIPPRAEMAQKYTRSRWTAWTLVAATVLDVGYLTLRGDATATEVEMLKVLSGLAMATTVAWMGAANGREAWVRGKRG